MVVDGNKRVTVMAASFWLEREGYVLTTTNADLVEIALKVASGQAQLDHIASWLESNSRPK
jgi:prophage maintenance system killer protein